MKKMFSLLAAFIIMATTLSAGLYDGLTSKVVEGQGVEVLLKAGSDDPLMKVIQALVLDRITNERPLFDPERNGLCYLVQEETVKGALSKASKILHDFSTNPITTEELDNVKALLIEHLGFGGKVDHIEASHIYGWLSHIESKIHSNNKSAKGFQFNVAKEDQEKIGSLIYALSHYSYWQLLWKQKDVNELGDSVRHVPPLQFLLICCGSEKLKSWMQNIRKSTLKWNGFINGLSDRITQDRDSGKLHAELPGFAAALKKKEHLPALEQHAASGNWTAFVDILLK